MDDKTIQQKYCPDGFELIAYHSGQTKGYVELKCKTCGHERTKMLVSFRGVWAQCRTHCPECDKADWEQREQQHRLKREQIKKAKKIERALAMKGEQLSFNICPICFKAFVPFRGRKFCSEECARRSDRTTYRHTRRAHMREQIIDKDITLEALALRDNNKCWLCGGDVDWKDCIRSGQSFIAGDRYPSIDHVIPLSKHGLHAWENIKLAHFGCNRDKGAKIV